MSRRVINDILPTKRNQPNPSSSNAYGSSGGSHAVDAPKDDLASKGAAAFREVKAAVDSVIADAAEKGHKP